MIVRPVGSGDGCGCNPYTDLILRIEELERRAAAIVKSVQGIPPDGAGEVTLPVSDDVDGPSFGRRDVFAMSSEVRQTAEDAHAYTAAVADDVVELTAEIATLRDQVNALSPEGYDALIARIDNVSVIVDSLIETKVSKSGDTMTGNLFIEASSNRFIYIKRTDLDRGVEQVFPTSGTTTVGGFIVVDKDGGAIGGMNRAVSPNEVSVTLQNSQTVNGTLRHCNLSLKIAKNGSMYATVPSPSGPSDNSTKIATTAWVNQADSVVHKTGNETVGGVKTFVNNTLAQSGTNPTILIQNTSKASDPKNYCTIRMCIKDNDATNPSNLTVGNINCEPKLDVTLMEMRAVNLTSEGVEKSRGSIKVFAKSDGSSYSTAPSTPSSATSDEIATANWVLQKINEFATANNLQGLQ